MRRLLLLTPFLLLGLPALGGDAPASTKPPATATAPAATPATPAPAKPATATPAPGAAPAPGATPAPSAAPAPAAPTTVTVAAPPAPSAQDAAMAIYEARKLKKKPLDKTDPLFDATVRALPGSSDPPWAIYHGNGNVVTAAEFASGTGDTATDTRITRSHKHAKILQWSLTGAGVALVGLSVVPLLNIDRSIGDVGPQPQSTDAAFQNTTTGAPDLEAFTTALTSWRTDRGIQARNNNQVLTAVALGSTGILAIVASPFAPLAADEREKVVPLFYSQKDADDRIIKYNIGVKKELGILAPDPTEVVIPTAPPPPKAPEDLDEGVPEGGSSTPGKPMELRPIQVQPWIGLGIFGVQGTF